MVELWANRYRQCNDKIINRINIDFVKNHCTFGDIGQLNLAFRDFNQYWNLELGYNKNFGFKPGTSQAIRETMAKYLYLTPELKKPVKTMFNKFTDSRWTITRFRDQYDSLNDKLIQMRSSGFRITDFEEEVASVPNDFKEAMESWNKTLNPMGAVVGIMHDDTSANDETEPADRNLSLVLTVEIPDITLQVYNSEKHLQNIPLNGGVRVAFSQKLYYMIDNFGTVAQGTAVRSNSWSPYSWGQKLNNMANEISHPFIGRRSGEANVCTGDLQGEIITHFINFRFVELVMTVHTWLTNFQLGRTYPLNPISLSHFGMPKSFGEDYAKHAGQNTSTCASRVIEEYRFYDTIVDKVCNKIECTLKDKCNSYLTFSSEVEQTKQREREERVQKCNDWITDLMERYVDSPEDGGHPYMNVEEEMYEWLYDTGIEHGQDAMELALISCYYDDILRQVLNGFCKGSIEGDFAIPHCEWGDLYVAIAMHPNHEIRKKDSFGSPLDPSDHWQFLEMLLVSDGIDGLQDFLIESLDLYHEKTITLKPTEISRKVENGVNDDRIKREMEEWASAVMNVNTDPATRISERNPMSVPLDPDNPRDPNNPFS